jgi:DNA-binding transcriptional ArsR family regulator
MVEYSSGQLDDVYGALSHPVRRGVIERLRPGGATVTQIAAPFEISLAAVSKHIGILEHAGLLTRTIHGREHHMTLETRALAPASEWLETYRRFWDARLDVLEAKIKASRL